MQSDHKAGDFVVRTIRAYKEGRASEAFSSAHEAFSGRMPHAGAVLGALYEFEGKYEVSALARARFYYQESIERDRSVEAQLGLARLLFLGKGGPQDFKSALSIYEHLHAESATPLATVMLGLMNHMGAGCAKNDIDARKFFELAASCGLVNARTRLAELDWAQGRIVASLVGRFRAAIDAYRIAMQDVHDERLRRAP